MVLTLMAHSGVSAAPVPAMAHATRASTIAPSRRLTRFVLITTPPWTPHGAGFRGLVGLLYARRRGPAYPSTREKGLRGDTGRPRRERRPRRRPGRLGGRPGPPYSL